MHVTADCVEQKLTSQSFEQGPPGQGSVTDAVAAPLSASAVCQLEAEAPAEECARGQQTPAALSALTQLHSPGLVCPHL